MMNTKKLILPSMIGCLAAGMTIAPAYAQDQEAGMLEEVVVTGIRRSLMNAIAIKENSSSIVEVVSAEDIGKLPDTSIAESLARLPGLAGERVNGRTSGISVRGFNEDYVATTMNGRELLGIGDNRGVEYDLYPSEIISDAVVYKTMQADLVNQGLGGVVDLRTLRPLENDRIISINGNYEVNGMESANPDYDDTGHRLAFTYSDTFANDTMGFAVTLASMESPSQEEQAGIWGYPEIDEGFIFGGHKSFVRSATMERDTISSVFQWEPTEDLSITVDALYIDFLESKVFRGFEDGGPVWGGANYTVGDVENGLVMNGEFDGFHTVIRNDGETKEGDLSTFGFNAKYRLNETWSAELDVATSESAKDLINMESFSGTGRAGTTQQGDPGARSWQQVSPEGVRFGDHSSIALPDYTDPAAIRLAGPQAWGGAIAQRVGGKNNAQDGFVNYPSFDEELDTLRLSAIAELNGDFFQSVELGLNYSDRTKGKVNYGAFLVAPGFDADLPLEDQTALPLNDPALASYYVGTSSLDYLGTGTSVVAYDGVGMYRDGIYTEIDATEFETDRLGDTYVVNEEVLTAYTKADFETGILSGNVGVQIIDTNQRSDGFVSVSREDEDTGLVSVVATPVSGGADYIKVLPSLNMNFQMTESQVVRFAAAKTLSRARMDEMRPNNTVNFRFDDARRESADPEFSAWSGSGGNPNLRPLEAVQTDLSYEYYFTNDGYVAASWFYKDLLNWHISQDVITNFEPYFIEGYHDAGTDNFQSYQGPTSSIAELGKGKVEGIELHGSLPFYTFSETLDGFGLVAAATFLDGAIEYDGEQQEIPGLSEESYQLTVYYEKNGFEFRVSGRKRDAFLTETRGLSLALTPTTDQGSELWDAQIGYDFGAGGFDSLDGLSVTLQAQNLTDEETVGAAEDDPRRITSYQTFGANYLLGVNYQF
ncbi:MULTISPECIES: TonB-dependent receptor [unclassified Marinimicrobium]|uniref:TonB-dependent receptor n=1 Tax=unclassified Marinimicrobium TaxID=2632100 RepID=UPI000C502C90|nr:MULTISPECIES: TonB-dependent receptor [unclassified Marinimicrobium]MAN51174.1 TonB-dependent receptor [Marinimicrobium sp.]